MLKYEQSLLHFPLDNCFVFGLDDYYVVSIHWWKPKKNPTYYDISWNSPLKRTYSKNSLAGVVALGLICGEVTGVQRGVFHSLLQLVQGSTELMEAREATR